MWPSRRWPGIGRPGVDGIDLSFGFQGTYTGANQPPVQFTLNGATCA